MNHLLVMDFKVRILVVSGTIDPKILFPAAIHPEFTDQFMVRLVGVLAALRPSIGAVDPVGHGRIGDRSSAISWPPGIE
jgi:hypothetical protein